MTEIEEVSIDPFDRHGRLVEIGPRPWVLVRGSRRWRLVIGALGTLAVMVVVVAAFILPIIEGRLVTRFVALSVALIGLQFVTGPSGQLSLCHGVFVGVGSYTMTILVARWHVHHIVGLVGAPVVGFAVGCLVGTLALRIRATYLGPVTLGVAVAFPMILKRFAWLTGGSSGLPLPRAVQPPSWFGDSVARAHQWTHLLIVVIAVAAFVAARNLQRSTVGLSVHAVADNSLSAAASGINVRRTRVVAYGWGAAFGALGGALLVLDTPIVGADNYDLFRSLGYFAVVMVGGAALMSGAVFGAAVLVAVPWLIQTFDVGAAPNLVLGALLVAATLAAPDGVAPTIARWCGAVVEVREPTMRASPRSSPRTGARRVAS